MNKLETKEDFFEFEREAQKFFNRYYETKGWRYRRISGKENIKYDVLVYIGANGIKIQEKARSKDYADLLVELVQDTATGSRGWLYTCEADWILYKTPHSFHWINRPKLKRHMAECGQEYKTKESNKGWGRTLNAIVPWGELISKKIAGIISDNIA